MSPLGTDQYNGYNVPYGHPFYQNPYPAPMIVELPAPLPPAPPTTTSDQQLKQDELLAHKLQQLEVEDARRRSYSDLTQLPRPSVDVRSGPQGSTPSLQQPSADFLRARSLSDAEPAAPWSPGSFGQPPQPWKANLLPDAVPNSQPPPYPPQSPSSNLPIYEPQFENFPIPVVSEEQLAPITTTSTITLADTALGDYLEQHRQVPYPPQWNPAPALETFFAYSDSKSAHGTSWLDTPDSFTWRTIRPEEHAHNPAPASYTFKYKNSHSMFRSPKLSWVMTPPDKAANGSKRISKHHTTTWAYDLMFEPSTGLRKHESLIRLKEKPVNPTYVHGKNYDTLRFLDPDDRACMWVTSTAVSSVDGRRYDTIRHALFMASGSHPDPLYGEIVADHTFWDGHIDDKEEHTGIRCQGCQAKPIVGLRWKCKTCAHHDVCNTCRVHALNGQYAPSMKPTCDFSLVNLPDEALYMRSTHIDPALVVATLQILKDWEKHSLRKQQLKNPKGFLASETAARKCDLGAMSYWKAADWNTKKAGETEKVGTKIKAKGMMHGSGRHGAVHGLAAAGAAAASVGGTMGGLGFSGGASGGGGGGGGS